MAASIKTSKSTCHARSISLPSSAHPLTASVEEQLYKLKASETTSSPSTSSMCYKLNGLKELYEQVDDLLQLPLTQQALSCSERHNKCNDEVLDASLTLLDMCSTTKDVFSHMKEGVQELESSLRRRRAGESGLANEIDRYMWSRKKLDKVIFKCLGNIKRSDKKSTSAPLGQESDLLVVISMLKEVEEISLAVFESLLSYVSHMMARSKPSNWSLFSKLLQSKRVSCEGEEQEQEADINQVEKIDAALLVLSSKKSNKDAKLAQVQGVLKGLEGLELSIQELEEELDCVFRRLVKTRVSLLNILNH